MTLCLFDPQRQLVREVVACEDGHASERRLIDRALASVEEGQCWVADRNFCVPCFLFGVADRQASFVVRHHSQLDGELLKRPKKAGRSEGGALAEQPLRVACRDGRSLVLRRVTIRLQRPTRGGETEIHLLSNLPASVAAAEIAALYRRRWSIETAFMHLATVLRSEVKTLGYPDAALFGFCIGLLLYNALSLLQAAMRTAQPQRVSGRTLSMYYLADEISGVYRGMMIAVPSPRWRDAFADLTTAEFAQMMLRLAKKVDAVQFFANPPPRKTTPPKRQNGHRGNHLSTQKLLQERQTS